MLKDRSQEKHLLAVSGLTVKGEMNPLLTIEKLTEMWNQKKKNERKKHETKGSHSVSVHTVFQTAIVSKGLVSNAK